MATDLTGAIAHLATSAQLLNELTDQATSAVSRVEEALGELNIGIETQTPLDGKPNRFLKYVRVGKEREFRITVSGQTGTGTPWAQLSRDKKIEAITALPRLILKLSELVDQRVEKASTALRELNEILPNLTATLGRD